MFDRLIDLIIDFIDLFRFWVVIDAHEWGLVYTLGRDTRILTPRNGLFRTGFHFLGPLNIEEVMTVSMRYEWEDLPYQSLVTKDGKAVVVQGSFKFRLLKDEEKFRRFVVELGDEQRARKIAMGAAIASVVENSSLEEIKQATDEGLNQVILDLARKELNQFDFKLYEFRWLQKTTSRTYRFMQDSVNTIQTDLTETD